MHLTIRFLFFGFMHRLKIYSSGVKSLVLLGAGIGTVTGLLPQGALFIITDTNVKRVHGHLFPRGELLVIEPGEESKRLEVVEMLCRQILEAGGDRSSFILGIGGGVVCDVAGLTASLFMRGVRHAYVSTTLLSQVDASIGGKTGVNLGEYKNLIGTFRQPEFVLCDHELLCTLPDEQFRSGMAELIKHAIIRDRNLFFDLSAVAEQLTADNQKLLGDLIFRSVKIKAAIVRSDPFEKGSRRLLNYGHTFGHVLESHYGISHGLAVAQGMLIAAELSVWKGEMPHAEYRLVSMILEKAGVLTGYPLPPGVVRLISRDKKSERGSVNLVLLRSVGKAVVRRLSLTEVQAFVSYYNEKTNVSH